LTIKLLDTKTGNVLSSVKGQLAKTKALDLLYDKNNSSKEINTNEKTIEEKTEEKVGDGILTIENKTTEFLVIFISTEQDVQSLKATKWEQITISKNTMETVPSLKPGIYYCCAVFSRYDSPCRITKKFEMIAGKDTKIVMQL
jgi:hypothetical protein